MGGEEREEEDENMVNYFEDKPRVQSRMWGGAMWCGVGWGEVV